MLGSCLRLDRERWGQGQPVRTPPSRTRPSKLGRWQAANQRALPERCRKLLTIGGNWKIIHTHPSYAKPELEQARALLLE